MKIRNLIFFALVALFLSITPFVYAQSEKQTDSVTMTFEGRVLPESCKLTVADNHVTLDQVYANEFSGVGVVLKPKQFNIGVDCGKPMKSDVNYTVSFSAPTTRNAAGRLANQTAGGATNVSLQIIDVKTMRPINFSNASSTPYSHSGAIKENEQSAQVGVFAVQYYQEGTDVTSGDVTSSMQITLIYAM